MSNHHHLGRSSRVNVFVLATICAAALAGAATSASAQVATPSEPNSAAPNSRGPHIGRYDPAKMQGMIDKRQADLKTKLKITPAQEAAWTSFTAAMQPPAGMGMRPTDAQRAEMDKLTAPERIDKMRAMRAERMTQMNAQADKRGNATKALYAVLSPEQQKVLDNESQKYRNQGERGEHGMRGGQRGL